MAEINSGLAPFAPAKNFPVGPEANVFIRIKTEFTWVKQERAFQA